MLYVILSLIWLGLAVVAFAMPWLDPHGRPWTFPGTNISLGWVALAFFGYNVARWYAERMRKRQRERWRNRDDQRDADDPER
jgi:hypothetical protein